MDVIICDLTADNASVNEVKRRAEAFRTQHPNGTVHIDGDRHAIIGRVEE